MMNSLETKTDSFHSLLFLVPTIASDWLTRFSLLIGSDDQWEMSCRGVVANEYKKNPQAKDGLSRVGWYLLTRGRVAEALPWFEADAAQGRQGWWTGLRYAESLAEAGRRTEAKQLVADIYSRYAEARNGYASIAWRLHKRLPPEEALEWVGRDEEIGRLTIGFALNHAVLLARAGYTPEAMAKVQKAYSAGMDPKDGYARLGSLFAENKDLDTAWRLAEKDLSQRRLSPAWKIIVAQWLGELNKLEPAVQLIESAYNENPELKDGYAKLAWIYAKSEDWFAVWNLAQTDVIMSRVSPSWRLNLAYSLQKLGKFQKAVDFVELAYSQDRWLRDGYLKIAWEHAKNGNWSGLCEIASKDMLTGRLSGSGKRNLAAAQLKSGNTHAAMEVMKSSLADGCTFFEHGHDLLITSIEDSKIGYNCNGLKPLMIEIGVSREPILGQMSTEKLALYCSLKHFDFVAIDMDAENIKAAKNSIHNLNKDFSLIAEKGEDFLAKLDRKVNFVYLDAYDYDHGNHSLARRQKYLSNLTKDITNENCYKMHLECAEALVCKMPLHGIVCFDDTWMENEAWEGKGAAAVPYLLAHGYILIGKLNRSVVLRKF